MSAPAPAPSADAAALRLGCVHLEVPGALHAALAARLDGDALVVSLTDFSGELRLVSSCGARASGAPSPSRGRSACGGGTQGGGETQGAAATQGGGGSQSATPLPGQPDAAAGALGEDGGTARDADGRGEEEEDEYAMEEVFAATPPAARAAAMPHFLDGHDELSDSDRGRWGDDDDDWSDLRSGSAGIPSQSNAPANTPSAYPASPPVDCPRSDEEASDDESGVPATAPTQAQSQSKSQVPIPAKRPREDDNSDSDGGDVDEDWVMQSGGLPTGVVTADRASSSGKRVRFTDGDAASASNAEDATAPWAAVAVANPASVPPRWGATLTRLNDADVLLIGGESDDTGLYKDMHTLSLDAGAWTAGIVRSSPGVDAAAMAALPRARLLPQPRAWHTATRVGDKVFVFGGEVIDDAGCRRQVGDMLSLDVEFRSCVAVTPVGAVAPPARGGHAACRLDDSIFVFGGIGGPGGSKWLSDAYVFHTATLEWVKCKPRASAPRPAARSYATLTVVGEHIVLFGGNNKSRSFGDALVGSIERKDKGGGGGVTGVAWREPLILGSAAPAPRTGHCAVASADGKSLIVYGGWDDLGKTRIFFSDVWELTFVSATECRWRMVHAGVQNHPPPSQPGKRAGSALCDAGGSADAPPVLVGGFRDAGQLQDAFKFDTAKCARAMPR